MTTNTIPTAEMVEKHISGGLVAKATANDSWDCRFQGTRTSDTDRFFAMSKLVGGLLDEGVDERLINISFSYKDAQTGNWVSFPRVWVNTKLSEQQVKAEAEQKQATEVETLRKMVMMMAKQMGVDNPLADAPAETDSEQPTPERPF
jgi:hypothetical protein